MKNIPKEIIKEAQADKDFAISKLQDEEWLNCACEISKKMVEDNNKMPVEDIARRKWDYLKFQASRVATENGSYINKGTPLDKSAKEKYERLLKKPLNN